MGNRDEPNRTLYTHVWGKGRKGNFIQTTKIKIPPPYPHKRKHIKYFFPTRRIRIFPSLQNDNVVHVFILKTQNKTDLHVYTYIRTYTKIIHTHTQISYRKKKHKCRHERFLKCVLHKTRNITGDKIQWWPHNIVIIHKYLTRSCWSTTSLRRYDLLIDTKIASANMNMASPTDDVAMLTMEITNFCSHTVMYNFHSWTDQRTIRSSRRMGMVPNMLYNTHTIWLRHSRKHERDFASRRQGSIQLETVGC